MRVRLVFMLISASEFGVGSVPDCRAFPKLAHTKRTCLSTHLDSRPVSGHGAGSAQECRCGVSGSYLRSNIGCLRVFLVIIVMIYT